MEKPFILHMLTPAPNVSPFDVNQAIDAGYNHVIPYTGISVGDVTALTQDAIFSRGPSGVKRTGIFIGGREIYAAADMLERAKASMVPPFEISVFADPSGAFTTAAAMVACCERQLKKLHGATLEGKDVVVLGGTGPVGSAAAVLAANAGARVKITTSRDIAAAREAADICNKRYGVNLEGMEASSAALVGSLMQDAQVVMACSKAGVRVLSTAQVAEAPKLMVAADVNAVPPLGIEGVDLMDDGKLIPGAVAKAVGIGALAIGNVKYQTMKMMFARMLETDKPVYLDFRNAFEVAREYVSKG